MLQKRQKLQILQLTFLNIIKTLINKASIRISKYYVNAQPCHHFTLTFYVIFFRFTNLCVDKAGDIRF